MANTTAVNTIPEARALAHQLSAGKSPATSTRYTHETQPVFAAGRIAGHVIRLSQKDNRGVTVAYRILRDEDARDFAQALSEAKGDKQVQWLIGTYIGEGR